jgi:hypothetical protein
VDGRVDDKDVAYREERGQAGKNLGPDSASPAGDPKKESIRDVTGSNITRCRMNLVITVVFLILCVPDNPVLKTIKARITCPGHEDPLRWRGSQCRSSRTCGGPEGSVIRHARNV